MRALICDLRTGRFYGKHGRWTPVREEACCFKSSEMAFAFVADNRLCGIEVVAASGSREDEVRLSFELESLQPTIV
jgi:hypothetical protein